LLESGFSEEAIAAALGDASEAAASEEEVEQAFAVHPSNSASLGVFISLRNKWRHEPMGGKVLSPDYPDVDVVLRRAKVSDEDLVFADYLVMEDAALKVLNKA
jgi:hypothetical protein